MNLQTGREIRQAALRAAITLSVAAWAHVASAQNAAEPGLKKELPEPLVQTPTTKPAVPDATTANREALHRASNLAHRGDHEGAAKVVTEVEARLGRNDPFVDEIRGTVLTLKHDYIGAETSFRFMLEKRPESHVAKFNIAETQFLQKRYTEAERGFAILEATRREADPALADLCRFKRVVCLVAAGQIPRAEELLPKGEKGPASPAVEYARAAIRYGSRSHDAAAGTVEHARKEFTPEVEGLYVDSFIELGWGAKDSTGRFRFAAAK